MSLRLRLALSAGFLTAVLVIVVAVGAFVAAADDLLGAVDETLLRRADVVADAIAEAAASGAGFDPAEFAESSPVAPNPGGRDTFRELGQGLDVFDETGAQVFAGSALPVADADLAVATGQSDGSGLRTESAGDETFRVVTVPVDGGGAVRLASDISDIEAGLDSFGRRLLIGTAVGALIVAAGAWLFAGRFVAPVTAVADAAEALAARQDPPAPLAVGRSDEVGRLADSFNELLGALRLAREQQERLVADASHELRTPLTSLRTKVEFLQSAPDLEPERRREVVDGAVVELERLTDLVGELVDLAADAGAVDEAPVSLWLDELVEAEAARFARASGRDVQTETERVELPVRPRAVTTALSNLLRNADKFSPPGAGVVVRQRGAAVEVTDRGPGIPPGDAERVFDRFYRSPSASGTDGSGIGLAIVARVAEIHGGETWVADNEGGGAIVGFSVAQRSPSDAR